jgi:hypothetical protein
MPGPIASCSFARHPNPSFRGIHDLKEIRMSRNASYVKFALLMLLLVALAVFMGSEPWGPI